MLTSARCSISVRIPFARSFTPSAHHAHITHHICTVHDRISRGIDLRDTDGRCTRPSGPQREGLHLHLYIHGHITTSVMHLRPPHVSRRVDTSQHPCLHPRNPLWPLHTPTGQVLHQEGRTQASQRRPEEVPRGGGYILASHIGDRLVLVPFRLSSHTTSCGSTEVSIMRARRVCSRLVMRSSSFMNESHGYIIHIRHIHTSAVECSPSAHRYTVCGRREHLAEERVLWGRPLSMSLHCTHITPIDIHIIYTSPSCATEVNAQHPNAIDRHVRVAQWKHWCRDKCR